jgi:hypothetical protein
MTTSISNASAANLAQNSAVQSNSTPKSAVLSTPASQPQDTVHLSAAALAASGDVDHDGDSH